MEYVIGIPQTTGLRILLETKKDEIIFTALTVRFTVIYFKRFISKSTLPYYDEAAHKA